MRRGTGRETRQALAHPGVRAALVAAALFGLAAPLGKLLLGAADPLMLAGLLYLGSGLAPTAACLPLLSSKILVRRY